MEPTTDLDLPSGTVTLLFTDIEGSTRLWEDHPDAMRQVLERHNHIVGDCIGEFGGKVFKTIGDAYCSSFTSPCSALAAALAAQARLAQLLIGDRPVLVRMALHTCTLEASSGDYFGQPVNRVARMLSVIDGGQIAASSATAALLRDQLPDGCKLVPRGSIRLKDISSPESLYFVESPGTVRAPEAQRRVLADLERKFVGREAEVEGLCQWIREGRRLITLSGIGGIGKTTLARHVASLMDREMGGRVWFVECEALQGRDELVAAMAAAVGDRDTGQSPTVARVAELVGRREALMVLDCFEWHVEHAGLVDEVVRALPNLRVLVTSRVVLDIPREYETELQPMSVAVGSKLGDSVRLFSEAAEHALPGFTVTTKNRATVVELCDELEGVPLALVLAASRLRHASLRELLEQMRRSKLDVLRRKGTPEDRHRNLIGVIDGSFQLLEPALRRTLRVLAVFVGGFTLDQAEAVVDPHHPGDVWEAVSQLRDHSLLQSHVVEDRTRFKILDSVREYLERLGDHAIDLELEAARFRHASWFAAEGLALRQMATSGRWPEASRLLNEDLANFREALRFGVESRDGDMVLVLWTGLSRALFESGFWSDTEMLAKHAEEAARAQDRQDVLASVLGVLGALARRRGQEELGARLWEQRAMICEATGDLENAADTLLDLAIQAKEQGDVPRMERLTKVAGRNARKARHDGLLSTIYALQCEQAALAGHSEHARELSLRALRHVRRSKDRISWLQSYLIVVRVYLALGDVQDAKMTSLELLRICLDGDVAFTAGWTLLEMGRSLEASDSVLLAARCYSIASRIHKGGQSRLRKLSDAEVRRFRQEHPEALAAAKAHETSDWVVDCRTLAGELSGTTLV